MAEFASFVDKRVQRSLMSLLSGVADQALVQCRANVYDAGPSLNQR